MNTQPRSTRRLFIMLGLVTALVAPLGAQTTGSTGTGGTGTTGTGTATGTTTGTTTGTPPVQ